jgi:hypothetical protein
MAAKKRSTKKVTIEIDIEVLEKLIAASAALSELANSAVFAATDPAVRAKLKKAAKKRR